MSIPFSIARQSYAIARQSYAAAFQFAYDFTLDVRDAFRRRFAIEDRGVFINLPLTSRSIWVEWRKQSVGFGIERPDSRTTEFFAGRIQGVISVETQPERASNEETPVMLIAPLSGIGAFICMNAAIGIACSMSQFMLVLLRLSYFSLPIRMVAQLGRASIGWFAATRAAIAAFDAKGGF